MISTRSEISKEPQKWLHYFFNGEEVFRELPQYGNRDFRFVIDAPIGIGHVDKYNAIGKPISHLAHWLHEKTGINESLLRYGGYALVGYGTYKIGKHLTKNLTE